MQFSDIDFIIIGAAKSATTWLQQQLQADPAVYMPDPELHYFSREYERGHDWYLSQFSDEGIGKVVGEKSNSYLYEPEAAKRLHEALPHVKLIAQLRHPVERAYSRYCMLYRRGEVGPDIEKYLDPSNAVNDKYLSAANYAQHLQVFIDLYGPEKLLVTFFEGVKKEPENQMKRVREHLGLPPFPLAPLAQAKVKDRTAPVVPNELRNRLSWVKPLVRPLQGTSAFQAVRGMVAREVTYPTMSESLEARLNDYFVPSIEALEKLSGQSLSHWYPQKEHAE